MPQRQCSVLKGCVWVGGSGDTTWGNPKLWEWLSFFTTEMRLLCEELSRLPVEHLAGRPSRSSLCNNLHRTPVFVQSQLCTILTHTDLSRVTTVEYI